MSFRSQRLGLTVKRSRVAVTATTIGRTGASRIVPCPLLLSSQLTGANHRFALAVDDRIVRRGPRDGVA
jgi:hypothetical protein